MWCILREMKHNIVGAFLGDQRFRASCNSRFCLLYCSI